MDILITQPPRGQGHQETARIAARAVTLTWAWGVNPSPGAITYVSSSQYPTILPGAWIQLGLFGRSFYGIVKGGPVVSGGVAAPTYQSSEGHEMRLDFVDSRVFLGWDRIFGTWNNVETRLVNNVYRKRYWHVLPEDFERWHKTYTDAPFSAAQIMDSILTAPTVGSPWVGIYHTDQRLPYNQVVDCSSGRALNEVIQEMCDTQGLTLTVSGGPYHLLFARKGDGPLPEFPLNSDQHRLESSLSEAPTRVFVVGDRNLYLLLNVAMAPDWNRNWEALPTPEDLALDLFSFESDPSGSRYNAIPGDTDHARGWQLAMARALSITVREYAAMRRARNPAKDFSDARRFANRSRMDMPAALYIRTIMFRAFRPPATVSVCGTEVPLADLRLVNEQVAFVRHDVVTGKMSATINPPEGDVFAGGNGYAIARGYNVGADVFSMIQPDRFNLTDFSASVDMWQPLTYSIDESGDGSQFILLDEPMLNTADLVEMVDGFAVLRAAPTFTIPQIRAALTFEGGRFVYRMGTGSRDDSLVISGLRTETIVDGGTAIEVPYADGLTSAEKARQLGESFLARPWTYRLGGFRIALEDGESAPVLIPTIGRLTLEQSAQGSFATIELEQDRPIRHYVPETILDRQARMHSLLPGQQELRAQSHAHRLLAAGLRSSPGLLQSAREVLRGRIGDSTPTHPVTIASGAGSLKVGTPLWKTPTVGSRPVMPGSTTSTHAQFSGVVTRQDEPAAGIVHVARHGVVLARVKGPVSVGDPVAQSPGHDYLVKKDAENIEVGSAQMAIATDDTKLIQVNAGAASSGVSSAVWA